MRMTGELLTLQAVLLSESQRDHDLFRHAASRINVPIEVVEANSAAAASAARGRCGYCREIRTENSPLRMREAKFSA
jgi:hypothetical protein